MGAGYWWAIVLFGICAAAEIWRVYPEARRSVAAIVGLPGVVLFFFLTGGPALAGAALGGSFVALILIITGRR